MSEIVIISCIIFILLDSFIIRVLVRVKKLSPKKTLVENLDVYVLNSLFAKHRKLLFQC